MTPELKNLRPLSADDYEAQRERHARDLREQEDFEERCRSTGTEPSDADSRRMTADEHRQLLKKRAAIFSAVTPALPPISLSPAPGRPSKGRKPHRRTQAFDPVLRFTETAATQAPHTTSRGGEFVPDDGNALNFELRTGLDWLSGVFPSERREEVRAYVDKLLGQSQDRFKEIGVAIVHALLGDSAADMLSGRDVVEVPKGALSYKESCEWALGDKAVALMAWTDGRGESYIDLPGDALHRLTPEQTWELCRYFGSIGFRASRVDCCVDDHIGILTMKEVHAAAEDGNYAHFIRTHAWTEKKLDGSIISDTRYFGVRGKDGGQAYVRVYNKALESQGEIDAIRMECEYRGEKSAVIFAKRLAAAESVESFLKMCGMLAPGGIDFRDRASKPYENGLDRLPRLDWWERFIALLAGNVRESVRRLVPPLASAVAALKRQWGGCFALLRIALQSMPTPANIGAVIENWCDHFEGKINWQKQQGRDLGVSLSMLLEGPYRAALAAQEV